MAKVITSVQHPYVKHLVRLHQNRDYRYEHHCVAIEGLKIIEEVCSSHPAKRIFTFDEHLIPKNVKAEEIICVNNAIMSKISTLQSPEGIVAEVEMPPTSTLKNFQWVVAFDAVNDPGNLGTLLRSALAFGWQGAFILSNSCDPFNDKALRAGKGATFRLPLAFGSWEDLKISMQENQWHPLVAHMDGDSIKNLKQEPPVLLVLNNESQGMSEEAKLHCKAVSIPMTDKMESLNVAVAGSILMYALKNGRSTGERR